MGGARSHQAEGGILLDMVSLWEAADLVMEGVL